MSFICAHENITAQYSSEQINHFKTQVLASQAHMEEVISTRHKAISIDGFIAAEPSLIGDHNLHPASKAYQS